MKRLGRLAPFADRDAAADAGAQLVVHDQRLRPPGSRCAGQVRPASAASPADTLPPSRLGCARLSVTVPMTSPIRIVVSLERALFESAISSIVLRAPSSRSGRPARVKLAHQSPQFEHASRPRIDHQQVGRDRRHGLAAPPPGYAATAARTPRWRFARHSAAAGMSVINSPNCLSDDHSVASASSTALVRSVAAMRSTAIPSPR